MDCEPQEMELAYWLALLRAPAAQIGLYRRLLMDLESPRAIFQSNPETLLAYGLSRNSIDFLHSPPWRKVQADLDWLNSPGNHLITLLDEDYPVLLKEIYDPPLALYVSGATEALRSLQISIVGSRRPTPDGRRNAREFAGELSRVGLTVTSGLAAGLDSEAHKGALAAAGTTIAVLGSGLGTVYPRQNLTLALEIIAQGGAVISELPPDYRPLPANFPRRNRIISGLSIGTLVVEAAKNSGSLITAGLAAEQGREVFALPGPIHSPMARGCHALIRQGAKLTEDINDILEELGPLVFKAGEPIRKQRATDKKIKELDELDKLLLDNIGSRPVSVDFLVEATSLPVSVVSSRLLQLELSGIIESMPGGNYIRAP
jgi:DNA processing protein